MAFQRVGSSKFVFLGDGKPAKAGEPQTVKSVTGFLVGFQPKKDKKSSHKIFLQDEKSGEVSAVFSATVINRVLLNQDETELNPKYVLRLVRLTYNGIGRKGKKNAYKDIAVEFDSTRKLNPAKVGAF